MTDLLAKIAEMTAAMEKLQTEKAAQDEEIKAMQVRLDLFPPFRL